MESEAQRPTVTCGGHVHEHTVQGVKRASRRIWHPRRWERGPDPRTSSQKQRLRHMAKCNEAKRPRLRAIVKRERKQYKRVRKEREAKRHTRCGSPSCNRRLADLEIPLSPNERECRSVLYQRESGWEETARNPSSGAYGIPQALPASKMGAAAQGSGWKAARAQLRWGASYVWGRYGSYCNAVAFHDRNNWY